jgi:lauroyl/myristoyl acyltransferase
MRSESTLKRWKSSRWLRWALAGTLACSAVGLYPAQTQEPYSYNEAEQMLSFNTVELKDQLMFGLRVAFPDQEAFVDQVIQKVDRGELSRAMVNVIYVWSKKRKPKIPFPYFEYVMRLLADQRGVVFE